MDYWNRDKNGDPVRKKPKEYSSFKTKKGRVVYDGGGILPDVELETAVFSPITTALLKDDAIFDYATSYYYENNMTQWSGFSLTDVDFENFIGFLKTNDFQYQTETEKELAKAISHADEDNLSASIASSYKE